MGCALISLGAAGRDMVGELSEELSDSNSHLYVLSQSMMWARRHGTFGGRDVTPL